MEKRSTNTTETPPRPEREIAEEDAPRQPGRKTAIHIHCRECNGVERFTAGNDCTDTGCYFYQFRPGNGPRHAKQRKPRRRVSGCAGSRS